MQLRDHLHNRGRSILFLLVLAMIAAVAVFVVVSKRPQQYDATVQVAVPAIYANSDSRIGLYLGDFAQTVTDPDLQARLHTDTKLSTDDLATVTATRVNLSSQLQVELVSSAGEKATAAAVLTAAKTARRTLAEQGLGVQQATAKTEQQALDAANKALLDYQNTTGGLFPDRAYQATQSNIRGLENSRAEAAAVNNATRVAALAAQITAQRTQLAALTPQVRQDQTLTDATRAAATALRSAQQALTDKQALVDAAGSNDGLGAPASTPVSRVVPLVTAVAVAVVVAVLLGLAILLVPAVLRRQHGSRGPVLPEPAGSDPDTQEQDRPSAADSAEPARPAVSST